jgi:hypothetical protein
VFHEDAPYLPDHFGMVQANVEATDDQLGFDAFQMRARVWNDSVGGTGTGRVTEVRDDRMGADRRIYAEPAEPNEERVLRGKLAGACRAFFQVAGSEEAGIITRYHGLERIEEAAGTCAEPCAKSSEWAAGCWRADCRDGEFR